MVTVTLTLLILVIIGLVIIQLNRGKKSDTVFKPVVQDEPPEIPVDDKKIERAKSIVEKLESVDDSSVSTGETVEAAKKIIKQVETKNTAIIAKVVKDQATAKKEASQAKIAETQQKLKELDIKAAQSLQKIKSQRDTVSKINTALDEVAARAQQETEEQEEKARLLKEEMEEKKRQAELRILAAKQKAEQAAKEKEERAAAFKAKMEKYAEDKAAAEAEVLEKEKKAKQARALEIALAKKALEAEAEAEMKRVLEEQRLLQEELKEKELAELQEAEEVRQAQLEENRIQMEEAKLKREEQEAEAAEAAEAFAEKLQMEKEEAEELRLAEEERLAEIEAERVAAEEEAAAVLEEERQRQEEMDAEAEELRLEQEDELRELEEERAAEAAEAQEDYELERVEYDRLKEELATDEAQYLEDAKEEARLSQISYDADIAANEQEQSATLDQNLAESEASAEELVERVEEIQETANAEAETATSLSESGVSRPSRGITAVAEPLKFFCLSPEPVPKLDDNGNTIGYYAYGDHMRDINQPTTIPEERCEEKSGVFDGQGNEIKGAAAVGRSETTETICTTHYVPNPAYVPPSDWDGVMDKEKCDSIQGFNWKKREQVKYDLTEEQMKVVRLRNRVSFLNIKLSPSLINLGIRLTDAEKQELAEAKEFLKSFDARNQAALGRVEFKLGLPGYPYNPGGETSSHCVHDESDTTFANVQNCIAAGGYAHHGTYTDEKMLATLPLAEKALAILAKETEEREARMKANNQLAYQAMKQNEQIMADYRARKERERAAYLESLRRDCEYQYSKTVKTGLKNYIEAIKKSATTLHPKGTPKARADAEKLLGYDPSAQECRPCDPFTKEYLHIIKEPSDPGKKSCPTEKIRKTPCTPVISCSEYTEKMNATTRARHEALLALETKNKSELKDLLVFARAESKARSSYERQVKRIDTVITASQKTRYDTAVAEKKKAWDDAKKKYNEEGQKLFSAYYDEVVAIPQQLHYCHIRQLTPNPFSLIRTKREDSLNKKYFGNDLPYDYAIKGEGDYIAPEKFAILASTLPLKNLPRCGGSRFSGGIVATGGPGSLVVKDGATSVTSTRSGATIKDSYYGTCSADAKEKFGNTYKSSGGNWAAVYDSSHGTTYILEKRRANKYFNGRVEHAKQEGSFAIEPGGKLVLIHAKTPTKEIHRQDGNGKKLYVQKTVRTYNSCKTRVGKYKRCRGGYDYSRADDTTKPIKDYTYYTRGSNRKELYNFNDKGKGYTLIANFDTKDFWLICTDGRYYSVTNNNVRRLDSSLKCKITQPVISNAIGGFKGMKKHIAQCFDRGGVPGCTDVYGKRSRLETVMGDFNRAGYQGTVIYEK
jgi:hypothetical protein